MRNKGFRGGKIACFNTILKLMFLAIKIKIGNCSFLFGQGSLNTYNKNSSKLNSVNYSLSIQTKKYLKCLLVAKLLFNLLWLYVRQEKYDLL